MSRYSNTSESTSTASTKKSTSASAYSPDLKSRGFRDEASKKRRLVSSSYFSDHDDNASSSCSKKRRCMSDSSGCSVACTAAQDVIHVSGSAITMTPMPISGDCSSSSSNNSSVSSSSSSSSPSPSAPKCKSSDRCWFHKAPYKFSVSTGKKRGNKLSWITFANENDNHCGSSSSSSRSSSSSSGSSSSGSGNNSDSRSDNSFNNNYSTTLRPMVMPVRSTNEVKRAAGKLAAAGASVSL